MNNLVHGSDIENKILIIRNQRVMIDRDLAELYGVTTKYLNRQVRRNIERFPAEFMFRLNTDEKNELVTNWHQFNRLKHSNYLPYVFTEHGVTMLAAVLNSKVAVKTSIIIVKTFIKLKQYAYTHKEVLRKLELLESKVDRQDKEIKSIFNAIKQLTTVSESPKRKIGFCVD